MSLHYSSNHIQFNCVYTVMLRLRHSFRRSRSKLLLHRSTALGSIPPTNIATRNIHTSMYAALKWPRGGWQPGRDSCVSCRLPPGLINRCRCNPPPGTPSLSTWYRASILHLSHSANSRASTRLFRAFINQNFHSTSTWCACGGDVRRKSPAALPLGDYVCVCSVERA